ncbi:hypothetical protein Tco_0729052 [Tanacetum coccineum]|uniref:Uncharacterized protein n=1 Tax=Tanacetum coccineum TaxID=301880 RepID=A0ABQ4YQ71_9ASTR
MTNRHIGRTKDYDEAGNSYELKYPSEIFSLTGVLDDKGKQDHGKIQKGRERNLPSRRNVTYLKTKLSSEMFTLYANNRSHKGLALVFGLSCSEKQYDGEIVQEANDIFGKVHCESQEYIYGSRIIRLPILCTLISIDEMIESSADMLADLKLPSPLVMV